MRTKFVCYDWASEEQSEADPAMSYSGGLGTRNWQRVHTKLTTTKITKRKCRKEQNIDEAAHEETATTKSTAKDNVQLKKS